MKRMHSARSAAVAAVMGFCFFAIFSATQAQAIAVFFDPASVRYFDFGPGDQITVDLRLDTEGETGLEFVAVSVLLDPTVLSFAGGASPGQILVDPDTLVGLAQFSQPSVQPFDPNGTVRAATFGALQPSGVSSVASSDQLLATLTFDFVGAGRPNMSAFFAQGDDIIVNGVSVKDSVTLGSLVITPEPGTALLMGLGLAGLAASRQRRG